MSNLVSSEIHYQLLILKLTDYYESMLMWGTLIYDGTYVPDDIVDFLQGFLQEIETWCNEDQLGQYTIDDFDYYILSFINYIQHNGKVQSNRT